MLNFIPHKIKVVEIMKKITVTNIDISISVRPDNNDYICLTDMAHFKDRERTNYIIQNWMRLRSTIDFLGLWEKLNNPNFKGIEFALNLNYISSKNTKDLKKQNHTLY